jgi:hypothetical protein
MKLEEIGIDKAGIGKAVIVKIEGYSLAEPMVFERQIGSFYSFIREQAEGEDILSFRVKAPFVKINDEGIEFSRKNSILEVYKPNDHRYENARSLLEKSNLSGGSLK